MLFIGNMRVRDELDTFKSLGTLAGAALCELRERQCEYEADQNPNRDEAGRNHETGDRAWAIVVLVLVKGVVSRRTFGRRVADNITHVHAPVVDLREF
jgi:hypothetical protein